MAHKPASSSLTVNLLLVFHLHKHPLSRTVSICYIPSW